VRRGIEQTINEPPVEPNASIHGGGRWRTQMRVAVHVGLLVSAAGALGTLQLLHVDQAYHLAVGFVFVGLVVIHLAQRRRTVARLANQFVHVTRFVESWFRLACSDLVLLFITANVLISGIVDWQRGTPTMLPGPLPTPLHRWHLLSAIVLVIYLVVHVARRRKRLWRSTIR
jgi:hypothetical protein